MQGVGNRDAVTIPRPDERRGSSGQNLDVGIMYRGPLEGTCGFPQRDTASLRQQRKNQENNYINLTLLVPLHLLSGLPIG